MVWKLVQISVAQAEGSPNQPMLSYVMGSTKSACGSYGAGKVVNLLRSNLVGLDPERLWELYIQLTQIEEAFRNLKGDLAIRPIYHQLE
jgi:hypothetical protein